MVLHKLFYRLLTEVEQKNWNKYFVPEKMFQQDWNKNFGTFILFQEKCSSRCLNDLDRLVPLFSNH